MSIPAWQVITWNPVETTAGEFARLASRFRHLGSAVQVDDGARGLKYGQVVWGLDRGSDRIGLAWEWAEVREHVLALADPMKVLSNLQIRRPDGTLMPDAERLLHLNGAIHAWRWQDPILSRSRSRAWAGRLAA